MGEALGILYNQTIIHYQMNDCSNYIQFLGSAFGPHPGIREILESLQQIKTARPYVGSDFTEYQWQLCRTMIGEKPKWPDCILWVFKDYSASKKILVHHTINRAL